MASTSVTLGEHWEGFIRTQIESGRYATASEVLRESLRLMERRDAKIEALRAAIEEGLASPLDGPFDAEEIKRLGREALAKGAKAAS